MRLRSGPEHRLPGPPPTHPFSRSTMSNINPTREHPREAGSSPRVEERAYTPRSIAESNSLLRIFGMPAQHNIHARFLMIVRPRRRPRGAASHREGTPSNKVRHRFGNLSLTVTEGNGMFQFVNQSRLKILHLWCSRCRPATRRAHLDSGFHDEGERSLRRYQASAAAPFRRPAMQSGLLVTAAAAVALAWYTSPERVAAYLVDRLPHLFLSSGAISPRVPTPPHSTLSAESENALSTPVADAVPTHDAPVSIAEREPPVVATVVPVVSAPIALVPAPTNEPAAAPEPAAPVTKVVLVEKGDTLTDILLSSGVARDDAAEAIEALDGVFRPKDLKPGQEITLGFDQFGHHPVEDGTLQLASLTLQPSVERDVVVNRNDSGGFVAQAIDRPLELKLALAGGTIESSLFEAGQDAAIPVDILSQPIKAFSYDVDFQREIQPGDRFEIVYERFDDERGQLARTGSVLYATLIQSGVAKEIYRFEPQDGAADFYNAKGENVRKELLRTPLDVVRIT